MDELDWTAYDYHDIDGTYHIVPSDREHDLVDCWCEPEEEIIEDMILVVHRAVN